MPVKQDCTSDKQPHTTMLQISHCVVLQVDILVNNAGLALGTAGVHQNDIQVSTTRSTHLKSDHACRVPIGCFGEEISAMAGALLPLLCRPCSYP